MEEEVEKEPVPNKVADYQMAQELNEHVPKKMADPQMAQQHVPEEVTDPKVAEPDQVEESVPATEPDQVKESVPTAEPQVTEPVDEADQVKESVPAAELDPENQEARPKPTIHKTIVHVRQCSEPKSEMLKFFSIVGKTRVMQIEVTVPKEVFNCPEFNLALFFNDYHRMFRLKRTDITTMILWCFFPNCAATGHCFYSYVALLDNTGRLYFATSPLVFHSVEYHCQAPGQACLDLLPECIADSYSLFLPCVELTYHAEI
ncbi:hypothetical protein GUJ93_ZPchr0013g34678 [Zizania palustris]|uniref:Uncharacterized protein n=1 Tax=Zizania palustris TaxID=103762 RepID=A0A8J5WW78_ZIZPA|nr:hypothetical protein GUJ93_ZPchr0013g34678 [Zizania palustris]